MRAQDRDPGRRARTRGPQLGGVTPRSAGGGLQMCKQTPMRALCRCGVLSREGLHVATVAQEVLLRER